MDMQNLVHLPTFIAVSEHGTFHKAAQLLGISQAAVTLHMKALETSLGAPLFKLVGRKKELTEFGKHLSEVAKRQLAEFETAILASQNRYKDSSLQELRVAARPEILQFVLPSLRFKGHLICKTLSTEQITSALLNGRLDLGISYQRPNSSEIFSKVAFESSLELIVHKSLLKRNSEPLNPESIRNLPALFYKTHDEYMESFVKQLGLEPTDLKKRVTCEDWRVIEKLVSEKMGFAIVPNYVTTMVSESVIRINLQKNGFKPFTYYYLFRKEYKKEMSEWI